MGSVAGLLAVFFLVFMNGFFVAAEFSLVGARRTRIAQLAAGGHRGALAAQQAIRHLDSYIAATQLGITLASLALGWIGEPAVAHLIEPVLEWVLPSTAAVNLGPTLAIAIGFSIVTMLHIVLGELAPKSIALQRPEATSIVIARPITWFRALFRPVIFVMNGVGNMVVRLLGFEPATGHEQVHSAEELGMLVRSSGAAGLIEAREERLLQRVFDFSDIHVREVMKPRVEVDAIDVETPPAAILEHVASGPYSRYPFYRGSVDNIVGILHSKDLLDQLVHQPAILQPPHEGLDITELLRRPLYVPAMASVDKVLEQMQHHHMHVAVVVDEFGGVAGIATMEDILEELVGEVQDEFDAEQMPMRIIDGVAVFDGLVSVHEVVERFGPPDAPYTAATIGGYIAERLTRIPTTGDMVPFGKHDVYVEEMDEMRVARVRMVLRQAPSAVAPASGGRPPIRPVDEDAGGAGG